MNEAQLARAGDTRPVAIASQTDFPPSPALETLVQSLRAQHGDAIAALLFYGSCLRSGDLMDGVVDLYLVVDDYTAFYRNATRAFANWLLPPNVFYLEVAFEDKVLRAKYAVISMTDLRHGTSMRWFHSYIWARFTQPLAIAFCRDDSCRATILATLASAVHTFLTRVLPRLPANGLVEDIWRRGFQLTYSAELRSERSGRSDQLTTAALDYYAQMTRASAPSLRYALLLETRNDGLHYRCEVSRGRRLASRLSWPARQAQGKVLSVLRLLKALFTFENGLDYIAWKLQRHSGQVIEIPARVRRYPLLFIWSFGWRLYRRGVFR